MWSADGSELFFVSRSGMMRVAVSTDGGFYAGAAEELFAALIPDLRNGRPFDVSADGETFYVVTAEATTLSQELVVVLNWIQELNERVPAD